MINFNINIKNNKKILALGAELDSAISFYNNGKITNSLNLNDLANNSKKIEEKILDFCTIKPNIVITDLHPEYNSTKIGMKLAKQWGVKHIKIQHHIAHIFSTILEYYLLDKNKPNLHNEIIGIACDGTGYGFDNTIWGGEIIKIKNKNSKIQEIKRIGHLEKQTLLGGNLAIEEPARMLITILSNFLNKNEVYFFVKKFYSEKTFNLLYSQLQQNFNCQQSTSCGRILDATSALLFNCNKREFKHQAIKILEKNSLKSKIYDDIETLIKTKNGHFELSTTPLFEYLIKNINKDKKRLASTVHHYIADGLYQIAQKTHKDAQIIFSGGMANNQVFKKYFKDKNVLINKKIPSGDPGISLGQICYYLLSDELF